MDDIKVSVLCTVYNHEKYLRRCLDGFVNQKTSFKYEVIVNDDCSQDGSVAILKEYSKKYPDLFKLILQSENQYSKGISIGMDILFPVSKGKYVAICEGDDYWCDENKLQRQYDYMEQHPECSMCVHNTIRHDLSRKKSDVTFHKWKTIHVLDEKDVFFGWNVHTSAYFLKRELFLLPFKKKYWFGDYVRLTYAYACGEVVAFPEIMSVYNYQNRNGVTFQNSAMPVSKRIKKNLLRAEYLEEFNSLTNNRFINITNQRIREIKFWTAVDYYSHQICIADTKQEMINAANKIFENEYYNEYINSCLFFEKIKFMIKYKLYYIFPVWKYLWKHKFMYKYKN